MSTTRRGFLRSLLGGAAAVVIAPALLVPSRRIRRKVKGRMRYYLRKPPRPNGGDYIINWDSEGVFDVDKP